MRHTGPIVVSLATLYATLAFATEPDEPGLEESDAPWAGPRWETDSRNGNLLGSVEVTPFPEESEQWLTISVFGVGLDYGWSDGPYTTSEVRSVPIVLPADASGRGLVQVFARLEATEPETGKVMAFAQTPAAYVSDAALPGEQWYDKATAEQLVVRDLTVALDANTEIDDIVGLEVL